MKWTMGLLALAALMGVAVRVQHEGKDEVVEKAAAEKAAAAEEAEKEAAEEACEEYVTNSHSRNSNSLLRALVHNAPEDCKCKRGDILQCEDPKLADNLAEKLAAAKDLINIDFIKRKFTGSAYKGCTCVAESSDTAQAIGHRYSLANLANEKVIQNELLATISTSLHKIDTADDRGKAAAAASAIAESAEIISVNAQVYCSKRNMSPCKGEFRNEESIDPLMHLSTWLVSAPTKTSEDLLEIIHHQVNALKRVYNREGEISDYVEVYDEAKNIKWWAKSIKEQKNKAAEE